MSNKTFSKLGNHLLSDHPLTLNLKVKKKCHLAPFIINPVQSPVLSHNSKPYYVRFKMQML